MCSSDLRSLATLKSMHTSLSKLTNDFLYEFKPFQIEEQMLAMVLYEWIDEYRKGSMMQTTGRKKDIYKADVNELIVHSPYTLLYDRYGRYVDG